MAKGRSFYLFSAVLGFFFAQVAQAASITFTSPSLSFINQYNFSDLTFGGSCSPNFGQVQLFVDNSTQASYQAQCSSQGAWSVSVSVSQWSEGNHSVRAIIGDAEITRNFIKDTISPTLLILQPVGVPVIFDNLNAQVSFSGICGQVGQSVQLTVFPQGSCGSSGYTVSTSCLPSLTWSRALNFQSACDGDILVRVSHQDNAGNPTVADRGVFKDTQPVDVTFDAPALAVINHQNQAQITLGGTCNKNNNSVIATITSNNMSYEATCQNNAWQIGPITLTEVPDSPSVQMNVYHVYSVNQQVLVAERSRTFLKDTSVPNVTIDPIVPAVISQQTQGAVFFQGQCTVGDLPVQLQVSSGTSVITRIANCGSNGRWFTPAVDLSALADGTLIITTTQLDLAQNLGLYQGSVHKDSIAPTLTITAPATNPFFVNLSNYQSGITLSGACSENDENVELSGAISASANCIQGVWEVTTSFGGVPDSQGLQTVLLQHSDIAGNLKSMELSFRKDTIAPEVDWVTPAESFVVNAANQSSVPMSGTCTPQDGAVTIQAGALSANTPCSSSGSFSTSMNLSSLPQGQITLVARQADSAQNQSLEARSITKDSVLPALTFSAPTQNPFIVNAENVSAVTLAGTCSEPSQAVAISGAVTATANCAANNTWSVTTSFANVAVGAGTVTASHSDNAQNSTSVSRSFSAQFAPSTAISSVQQLMNISQNLEGSYYLTQDLDFSGVTNLDFVISGNFEGTIDGQGFKIKNLNTRKSFINYALGSTLKNITFVSPKFGLGSQGKGLVAFALHHPSGRQTRFENVHLIDATIYGSTSSSSNNPSLSGAGGLVGIGSHLLIQGSSVDVTFTTERPGVGNLGGLVGYLGFSTPTQAVDNRIENSRVKTRVVYQPSEMWTSTNTIQFANVGGVVGLVDTPGGSDQSIRTSLIKVEAEFVFRNQVPETTSYPYSSNGVAGLIGLYLPQISAPGSRNLFIEQSHAILDVETNAPVSAGSFAGLFNESGSVSSETAERKREIKDSFASGQIAFTTPLSAATRVAGLVTTTDSVFAAAQMQMSFDRSYSSLVIEGDSVGPASKQKPVFAKSFDSSMYSLPVSNGLFYDLTAVPQTMSQDLIAQPLSSAQMRTPATWISAGYSSDVWEIVNGELPTLKGITTEFPPAPPPVCVADINGDGSVGAADLGAILSGFGSAGPTDLNQDGTTNSADLAILLSAWGSCPE